MTLRLVRLAGALSLLASALHAAVIDRHLEEWWGYGLAFILMSLAQGVFGLVLLALPARPNWEPRPWARWRRGLYALGIAGNLVVLLLYVVTRTAGIPFFGPEAGVVEDVGAIDVASKVTEAVLIGLLALLRLRVAREPMAQGPTASQA